MSDEPQHVHLYVETARNTVWGGGGVLEQIGQCAICGRTASRRFNVPLPLDPGRRWTNTA
jgi:hypothetical protein